MMNPTGKEIRYDAAGAGHFGAPRGERLHTGIDFICEPGQPVWSPITGKYRRLIYPYAGDLRLTGCEIVGPAMIAQLHYLAPHAFGLGSDIEAGQEIGRAQDVRIRYPHLPAMRPHIHLTVYFAPNLLM